VILLLNRGNCHPQQQQGVLWRNQATTNMPLTAASRTATARAALKRNGGASSSSRRGTMDRRKQQQPTKTREPCCVSASSTEASPYMMLSSDEDKENATSSSRDFEVVAVDSDSSVSSGGSCYMSESNALSSTGGRGCGRAATEHMVDSSSSPDAVCSAAAYMDTCSGQADMLQCHGQNQHLECSEDEVDDCGRAPMGDVTSRYTSNHSSAYESSVSTCVDSENMHPTPPPEYNDGRVMSQGSATMPASVSTPTIAGMTQQQSMTLALGRFPENALTPANNFTPDTFAATKRFISSSPITPTTSKFSKMSVGNLQSSCPLPNFNWGDSSACWNELLEHDDHQLRVTRSTLMKHTHITPYHRSVVLEWLSEVTESYKLRKDTYYLAVNYFDRYLSLSGTMSPEKLQLLGTTALFTASKFEEIYPPKSEVFAYVTDGLCELPDVISFEIVLVHRLAWKLGPATPLTWLLLFLQLANNHTVCDEHDSNNFLVSTKFNSELYLRATAVIDLAVLDYGYTQFSSRMIAASTLIHIDPSLVELFSFLNQSQLRLCFDWLAPFFLLASSKPLQMNPDQDDKAEVIIHSHRASLSMLKEAQKLSQQRSMTTDSPQATSQTRANNLVLTPPAHSGR
jgi:cyclin E